MALKSGSRSKSTAFTRRSNTHKIIIAKGDKVTSMSVHPFAAGCMALIVFTLAIGYLGATAYLMFRDDLLNANQVRQVTLQNAYEDRLALLRTEIDRIASRQMLDQRSVENKLDRLLGLRVSLDDRNRTLKAVAEAAERYGIRAPIIAPSPRPHPKRVKQAKAPNIDTQVTGTVTTSASTAYADASHRKTPFDHALNKAQTPSIKSHEKGLAITLSNNTTSGPLTLDDIEKRLQQEEKNQLRKIRHLTQQTAKRADHIARTIRDLGFRIKGIPASQLEGIGGPYIEAEHDPLVFDQTILQFEENLTHLNRISKKAKVLPIRRPVRHGQLSSSFGRRVDPFLGKYAFHSGLDFRAPKGTSVYATASGRVTKASWSGGYGRLVEIKHAGGITTRYAHLSRITVKVGQKVAAGTLIGKVGSTGRSTGPHLHYETRINKKARNPRKFLNAGSKLARYL